MSGLSDAAIRHLRSLDDAPMPTTDRYEVLELLGRGGMGLVYRVRDRELGRDVALKVLGDATADAAAAQRLLREARALARLEHPGIVPVHDVGELADGRLYYVMKLVRGDRLDERVAAGLPLGESLRVFTRICDAVAFAHAHGVIHRDLKPQNVMLGPFGDVLVLDWGVAVLRGDRAREAAGPAEPGSDADSRDGLVMGTPGYMAPEQAAGTGADERADVYSLGVILREIVRRGDEPAPRPLASIVRRATAVTPGERYPSADALAEDVAAWLDGRAVSAHRESLVERIARVARRHSTALGLVLVYVLVRLLLLAFSSGRRD
jgi:serine/threonine-protein kinase